MSNTREKILPQQNSNYSEIESVLRSFFQYLCDQQLSKKSVKNYVSDARQYLEWLEKAEIHTENTPILEEISVNSIQEYKSFLLSKAIPLSSINRYLASLRQFGSFLQTVHQLKLDLHSISNISTGYFLADFSSFFIIADGISISFLLANCTAYIKISASSLAKSSLLPKFSSLH